MVYNHKHTTTILDDCLLNITIAVSKYIKVKVLFLKNIFIKMTELKIIPYILLNV